MRKITFVFFILLLALISPTAVLAQRQQAVRFQHIQIDLWPEYDRPAMLVIYRAVLSNDVALPADLTIRIPATAGEPNAVAVRSADGVALNADYELQVLDEWAYINMTTNYPEIQIEYYDPGIVRDETYLTFTYDWPGDYAADNVVMLVQQPTGATNVSTMPRLTEITRDSSGLLYLQGEIGAIGQGETFSMTVTYEKTSDDLTVNFLPIDSSQPITSETPGRLSIDTALPYVMGVLGLLIIVIAAFWYWSTGRAQELPKKRTSKAEKRSRARVLEPEMHDHNPYEQNTFCHQCGKRANPGDKFCRSCGTKLRI